MFGSINKVRRSNKIIMLDLTEFFNRFQIGFGIVMIAFFLMFIFFGKLEKQARKK